MNYIDDNNKVRYKYSHSHLKPNCSADSTAPYIISWNMTMRVDLSLDTHWTEYIWQVIVWSHTLYHAVGGVFPLTLRRVATDPPPQKKKKKKKNAPHFLNKRNKTASFQKEAMRTQVALWLFYEVKFV